MFSVIFPGQGSQIVGMGKELYEKFNVSSATLNKLLTISNLSYNSFPIATICEPWPGKITENI